MDSVWQDLIANLAVTALLTSIWSQSFEWLETKGPLFRHCVVGAGLGLGILATLALSVELRPGIMFDLRTAIMAVGAFFGGPAAALIGAAIGIAERLVVGGEGAPLGATALLVAAAIGLIARRLAGTQPHALVIPALGAAIAGAGALAIMALPANVATLAMADYLVPGTLLNFVAALLMGLTLLQTRRSARINHILRTALEHAPDFQYVKDTKSRFIAANRMVATHHGFETPAQLIGKTDFDLSPPSHAKRMFEQEQRMILSGRNVDALEEQVIEDGGRSWYLTSKSLIHDHDGAVVGLTGVTVDITARKELESQLRESRNLLSLALQEMTDGIAVFDEDGILIFCNDQYRNAFPRTAHLRRPGVHIGKILRAVVETGEQTDLPEGQELNWIDEVSAALKTDCVDEVELNDGRFLRLRNRPTSNGGAITVLTDITDLKRAELVLKRANSHLAALATTDGLTLLPNRRAFNDTLKRELARSRRTRSPFSLLMIDVDHFKAYNDQHGHQAGDRCLKMVAQCMKAALRRPADMAARYGGEEFGIILPETDAGGARFVANSIAEKLRTERLIHQGSDKGIVTVSIGAASYEPEDDQRSPVKLISRADEALYKAKHEGRDRVVTWQETEPDALTGTA